MFFSITAAKISINQSSKQSYQLFCLSNEVSAAKEEEALGSSAEVAITSLILGNAKLIRVVHHRSRLCINTPQLNLHTILGDSK